LRAIVVAFGNQLAWSDTLDGALDALFGGNSGAVAADSGAGTGTATPPPAAGGGPAPAPGGTSASPALRAALADVQKAFGDGQAAIKRGDFAAYGEAQKRLQAAIGKAVAAQPSGSVTLPTPTAPTTTARPVPSATATR